MGGWRAREYVRPGFGESRGAGNAARLTPGQQERRQLLRQDPHASVDAVDEIETIPHREDRPRVQEPESQAYTDIDYAVREADRDAASVLQDGQSGYGGGDDVDCNGKFSC